MIKSIIKSIDKENINEEKLPSFIYNRYDLWDGINNYVILEIDPNFYVEVLIENEKATIGTIMLNIKKKNFI